MSHPPRSAASGELPKTTSPGKEFRLVESNGIRNRTCFPSRDINWVWPAATFSAGEGKKSTQGNLFRTGLLMSSRNVALARFQDTAESTAGEPGNCFWNLAN